jgi:hypothetical protein
MALRQIRWLLGVGSQRRKLGKEGTSENFTESLESLPKC